MSAVLGSTRTVSTYADGSLLIKVEVEPRDAQEAFRLFGTPGTPIALALITNEAATAHDQMQTWPEPEPEPAIVDEPEPDDTKGGTLARLAGMFCNQPAFLQFLTDSGYPAHNADEAAQWIRDTCHVKSRAELDHDETAAHVFHHYIRLRYVAWKERQ